MTLSRLQRSLVSAQRSPFLSPDGDGGGGGDGGTGAAGGTGVAGNNDANSSGNGGTGAAGGGEQKVEPVTFVHEGKTYVLQDHVNKLVGTARNEGKASAEADATRKASEAAAKEKGDFEKLANDRQARIEALERDLKQRDHDALRAKVAAKHKLPDVLAARLTGDDEAALEADAKELAKHVKPPTAAETEAGSGNRSSGNGLSTRQGDGKAKDGKDQPTYPFLPARGVPIPT